MGPEEDIAVSTLNPALTATGFFQNQLNPQGLPDPDLDEARPASEVAQAILALDRTPKPEVSLRWKWRLLGILSILSPRLADHALVRRLGGDWRVPRSRT